jgi:hypothetical protein
MCGDTEAYLGNHTPVALGKQISIAGFPSARHDSGTKGSRIKRDLWSQLLFCAVIGDEIPDDGMTRPPPEAGTPATVVARFKSEKSIPEGGKRVLDYKLALTRGNTADITPKTCSPRRRAIVDLISKGEESSFYIDTRGGETLSQKELKALMVREGLERSVLINIGSIQPIDVELGWGASWRLIRATAVLGNTE